jgi:hypothetical protein
MATVRHLGLFPRPFQSIVCPNIVSSQNVDLSNIDMDGSLNEATRLNAWMTLDQVMTFIWRVKTWKITHSSSFSWFYDDESYGPFTIEFEQTLQNQTVFSNPPQNPMSEGDLICGLRALQYGATVDFVGSVSGSQGYNVGSISYHQDTNTFRPDVFVGRFGFRYFYPSIFDPIALGLDDRPPFFGEIGSATLQIGAVGYDQSFPVYLYDYASANPTGYFSHTIAAEEYWPYDPGDGLGPIYDSTTGEQLREFPA